MYDPIKHALTLYDITVKAIEYLNDDRDVARVTDEGGRSYFLKLYGKANDYDIIPGQRVYHTRPQIQAETEILLLLAEGGFKTARPVKNSGGQYVTELPDDADGEPMYATVTSFIDAAPMERLQPHMTELAYSTGQAAARLHLESQKLLNAIAVKRPHKRQAYAEAIRARLTGAAQTGILTAAQLVMLGQCCDIIIDCMNRLDFEPAANVGLVHTDIIHGNCFVAPDEVILVDFSRSVYSYYLYDLAEMCLHGDFGGISPMLQNAMLRGYHSLKPLTADQLFCMQVMFVLFILTVMAESLDAAQNEWRDNVLVWLADKVLPGLVSGQGYMKEEAFAGLLAP